MAEKNNKILFTSDLFFGMSFYIKNDPCQDEYKLIGIRLTPGATDKKGNQIPGVKFRLQSLGVKLWIDDFLCSTERDELLVIKNNDNGDDD